MKIKQIPFPTWEEFKKIRRLSGMRIEIGYLCLIIEDRKFSQENNFTIFEVGTKNDTYSRNNIIFIKLNRVGNEKEYLDLCQQAKQEFEKYITKHFLEE